MKIKILLIFFLAFIFINTGKGQINTKDKTIHRTENERLDIPKALNDKYSNKIIILSINSIFTRYKDTGVLKYSYPNINAIDTLKEEQTQISYLNNFFKGNQNEYTINVITKWCDTYILYDALTSAKKDYSFEKIIVSDKSFNKVLKNYFINNQQDINSLSFSQMEMVYLDFICYLAKLSFTDQIKLVENLSKE